LAKNLLSLNRKLKKAKIEWAKGNHPVKTSDSRGEEGR